MSCAGTQTLVDDMTVPLNVECRTSSGNVDYMITVGKSTTTMSISVTRIVLGPGTNVGTSNVSVALNGLGLGPVTFQSGVVATTTSPSILLLMYDDSILTFEFTNLLLSLSVTVIPRTGFQGIPVPMAGGINIEITAQLNSVSYDVLEVVYAIRASAEVSVMIDAITGVDVCISSLDGYQGTVIRKGDTTNVQVVQLLINKVVRGKGMLIDKTICFGISVLDLLKYVLTKLIMGKLIFNELNLCWALTANYDRLLKGIRRSVYRGIIPYLITNSYLEAYLR